jgi:hypothetical protein
VTLTELVAEARKLELPANEAAIVSEPAVWLTLVIVQEAVPFEPVVPLQVCAVPPLPRVNSTETPDTAAPPAVCVSVAEGFAALPFVNVVGPLYVSVVATAAAAEMVTLTEPVAEARKLELPANEAEMVSAPAVWLTLAIVHVAVPFEPVVPLQVCAVPPLPSVNSTETPTTAAPPLVCVSVAEGFAALPFVNVVGPLYVSVVATAAAAEMVTETGPADDVRKLELPANEAAMVSAPAVWLTLEIEQVAAPFEPVVPLHVCVLPPLPSVNSTETPTTAAPPLVCVSVAEGFAPPPFVNVVGPLYVSVVATAAAAEMVTLTEPVAEARKLELPANEAAMASEPAVWLTLVIVQVAVPFEPVVPLQVCAVPPLPRVNKMETPETAVPPVVFVSVAEGFAALPFVNVVGLSYVSVVATAGATDPASASISAPPFGLPQPVDKSYPTVVPRVLPPLVMSWKSRS